MADYRCYFFGMGNSPFGAPISFEAAEDFRAETDDEARMRADTMYRQRRNQIHGFEVWRANRLVCRHPASSGEDQVSSKQASALGEEKAYQK